LKSFKGKNVLAYFDLQTVMKRNTFIRMVTVVNLTNLLLFVNYLCLSLERLERDKTL